MRRTLLFRVLAVSVAAATVVTALPTAAAAGGTPADQPLPGYTIVNPPLAPATVGRPADHGAARAPTSTRRTSWRRPPTGTATW